MRTSTCDERRNAERRGERRKLTENSFFSFWYYIRNDKVSIAAKNLRNAWMQLAEKGKQPNNRTFLEERRGDKRGED
jgi:hypothetical protein